MEETLSKEEINDLLNEVVNVDNLVIDNNPSYKIIDELCKYFSSSSKLNNYNSIVFNINLRSNIIDKVIDLLFVLSEKYDKIDELTIYYNDIYDVNKTGINRLTKEQIKRLSDFIKLNKLECLYLNYCFASFDNLELFCEALTSNTNIKSISLINNHFNNYTLSLIFNSLKSNDIETLNIKYRKTTFNYKSLQNDKYLFYIKELLKVNHNIINLIVHSDEFIDFDKDEAIYLSEILKYSSIQYLKLDHNRINDEIFNIFYNSLKDNNNLTDLDLSYNHLTNDSYIKIVNMLKTNKSLISLNLDGKKNNEIEIFTDLLKDNLKNNNTLMYLNIGDEFFGKRKDHTKSIMNLIEMLKINKILSSIKLPTYIIRNKKYKKLFYDNLQEIRHIKLYCYDDDEFYEL